MSKKSSEKHKNNTCLALITAVDIHGKTSLLAAALMNGEKKENYEFFLQCYESVGYRRPSTIITDQHVSLLSSIKEHWGHSVKHHLCLFHIYRDIQKRLGNCSSQDFFLPKVFLLLFLFQNFYSHFIFIFILHWLKFFILCLLIFV